MFASLSLLIPNFYPSNIKGVLYGFMDRLIWVSSARVVVKMYVMPSNDTDFGKYVLCKHNWS